MKITFLLTQSLESPSGLGRYWPIAFELTQLGHQVTILALHHNLRELERRRFSREGVDVWYVGQMHVRKFDNKKEYFTPIYLLWVVFLSTLGLLWAALQVPTDAYHLGKPHPMNGIAGLVAHWIRRKPLYLDCDDYEAGSNRFSKPWQRCVVAFFEDRLPCFMKSISVNTRFMEERLSELGISEHLIFYVPNGVDRERFETLTESNVAASHLRQNLGLDSYPVVLYAGSLSLVNHAVDLLLKSFELVVQRLPEAMLVLVGGGEDIVKLQRISQDLGIEKHVEFVGRVPPNAVSIYYQIADVSVDPVRDEPAYQARSPLKLFESWAMEVPFVTGDVGDRRELLGNPPAGEIAEDDSPEALAEAIINVLRSEELARVCRLLGKERVQRAYWDERVFLFERIYESCFTRGRS